MQQFETLNDVFIHQVTDLYDAEQQLVEALPKMAQAASHEELRQAFEHHLDETRDHVRRLQDIVAEFAGTGVSDRCQGMAGLIREGEQVIAAPTSLSLEPIARFSWSATPRCAPDSPPDRRAVSPQCGNLPQR